MLDTIRERVRRLKKRDEAASPIEATLEDILAQLADLSARVAAVRNRVDTLQTRSPADPGAVPKPQTESGMVSETAPGQAGVDLDRFFSEFSDEFRGSEGIVSERLRVYLPHLADLPPVREGKAIVDVGCGRGELLRLLSDSGVKVVGVDTNAEAVGRATASGLHAVLANGLTFLSEQPNDSLAAVTGIHIVEHLSNEERLKLFQECQRVLSPGGAVIFETPNPRSAFVGSYSFWLDPSHLTPVPPPLLDFSLRFCGFLTESLFLQPMRPGISPRDGYVRELHDTMFGYADYAVIGRKPA